GQALVYEDALVEVAEAVVTDGHVIQDRGADRPVLRYTHQPAWRVLKLIYVRGQSRRWAPASSRRVIALPEVGGKVARQAMLGVDEMVHFGADDVLVKHRAARGNTRIVPEHIAADGVRDAYIEDLTGHRIPAALRNKIPRERIAHDAIP